MKMKKNLLIIVSTLTLLLSFYIKAEEGISPIFILHAPVYRWRVVAEPNHPSFGLYSNGLVIFLKKHKPGTNTTPFYWIKIVKIN